MLVRTTMASFDVNPQAVDKSQLRFQLQWLYMTKFDKEMMKLRDFGGN